MTSWLMRVAITLPSSGFTVAVPTTSTVSEMLAAPSVAFSDSDCAGASVTVFCLRWKPLSSKVTVYGPEGSSGRT